MPDMLELLREANPVDAEELSLPRTPRRPARRRHVELVAVVVAIGVAALALMLTRGGSADLAARAYAATNGGITHWRTDIVTRGNGRFVSHERVEGWASAWTTHVLLYDVVHGKARLTSETRVANGRAKSWGAVTNDYVSVRNHPVQRAPLSFVADPMALFRRAYREERLTRVSARVYRLASGAGTDPQVTYDYELDPRTARPRRLVMTSPRSVITFDFARYERLDPTTATRAKLDLLPHPGAGPSKTPAAEHFAALRDGAPPAAADEQQLARMAGSMRRFHVDRAGIRVLAPDVWLAPGRGYVCMFTRLHGRLGGFGGTCDTVDTAVQRGLSSGTPGGEVLVAVADDVTAVRARIPGRWKTFPVRDGLARLPWPVYQKRLIR